MATLLLDTRNHYTLTTAAGDTFTIERDLYQGRKGIADGRMVLETGLWRSGTLLEGIQTPPTKYIINGVIYEDYGTAPIIAGGGILADGITLEQPATGTTYEVAATFAVSLDDTNTATITVVTIVEGATTYDISAGSTFTGTSVSQATTTATVDMASIIAATTTAQAITTDNLDAGFTVTAEVIQLTGLNNNRISAMHFQRHYEPIAVAN